MAQLHTGRAHFLDIRRLLKSLLPASEAAAAFRLTAYQHLLGHKVRTVLTVGGIALGVAAIISMRLMHESVADAYRQTIDRLAGKATLQITNGEVGIPEQLLDDARSVPGVKAASAAVHGFVAAPIVPGERLFIYGIDLLGDRQLADSQGFHPTIRMSDSLLFVGRRDSIALSADFLESIGLRLGDKIEVLSPQGKVSLTIRATIDGLGGAATIFGGRLAVMHIYPAQSLLSLERRFTQIDISLDERVDIRTVEKDLLRRIDNRGVLERPRTRGEALENLLVSNRYAATLGGSFAVAIGLYVVFSTMTIAVVERRREIGILRAIGMRRKGVVVLVALESFVLAAVGCVLGVALGTGLARGITTGFAAMVTNFYTRVDAVNVTLRWGPVLWGVGAGFCTALLASIWPAREASRIHPLEALRRPSTRVAQRAFQLRAAMLGVTFIAVALAVWMLADAIVIGPQTVGNISTLGLLIGVSFVVPLALHVFAKRSAKALGLLFGPLGTLAARGIVDHIGKLAVTCAAFVVSLAGALTIATWVSSFQRTLTFWFDSLYSNVDLLVTSGAGSLSADASPFSGALADEMRALPDIRYVNPIRIAKIAFHGSLVALVARDTHLYKSGLQSPSLLAVDQRGSILDRLAKGHGVLVNQAAARRYNVQCGDVVSLTTPGGEIQLPVLGITFDLTFADLGTLTIDRELYRRFWGDDTVTAVELGLVSQARRTAVAVDIRNRWAMRNALFIITAQEFRREANNLLRQNTMQAYLLIALTVSIALFGVVNSLMTTVHHRIRELAILRAVGASRKQIAYLITMESSIIGFVGALAGIVFGSLAGYVELDILMRRVFGMTVFYSHPTPIALLLLFAATLFTGFVGYVAGSIMARLKVAEALTY